MDEMWFSSPEIIYPVLIMCVWYYTWIRYMCIKWFISRVSACFNSKLIKGSSNQTISKIIKILIKTTKNCHIWWKNGSFTIKIDVFESKFMIFAQKCSFFGSKFSKSNHFLAKKTRFTKPNYNFCLYHYRNVVAYCYWSLISVDFY